MWSVHMYDLQDRYDLPNLRGMCVICMIYLTEWNICDLYDMCILTGMGSVGFG